MTDQQKEKQFIDIADKFIAEIQKNQESHIQLDYRWFTTLVMYVNDHKADYVKKYGKL